MNTNPPPLLVKYFGPGLDAAVEDWSAETLRAYQTESIAEQLRHVHSNNAFYRAKFQQAGVAPDDFRQLEDLARFPFTLKDELRGQPWRLLSVPKEEVRLIHTSTGTTGGDWSYQLYTWDDMHIRDFVPTARRLLGVRPGDVVINALPYEMSSAGQSFQRSLQGSCGATVVPVGKGGFYADPYKTARILADLQASVLITTPPYALLLSEIAEQLGLRPGQNIQLRCLWLTGEGCSPAYRQRLEQRWHCPGLVFYGSLECGAIGLESPQKNGCHISVGHVYVEIVNPRTGQPQPPGQLGEVVCTVLQRKAAPLIRFRTQDLAVIDPAPDNSGLGLPRLFIRGRVVDEVSQGGQPEISPYQIEQVLFSHPAVGQNYQIYTRDNRLIVEVELLCPQAERSAVLEQLRQDLERQQVQADVVAVEHIPRIAGKARRVRPWSEREPMMAAKSLLRREAP